MGYLGVRGASDSECRFCKFGCDLRCGPGAKVADGDLDKTGDFLSLVYSELFRIAPLPPYFKLFGFLKHSI